VTAFKGLKTTENSPSICQHGSGVPSARTYRGYRLRRQTLAIDAERAGEHQISLNNLSFRRLYERRVCCLFCPFCARRQLRRRDAVAAATLIGNAVWTIGKKERKCSV